MQYKKCEAAGDILHTPGPYVLDTQHLGGNNLLWNGSIYIVQHAKRDVLFACSVWGSEER